jgi:hypothetical protein
MVTLLGVEVLPTLAAAVDEPTLGLSLETPYVFAYVADGFKENPIPEAMLPIAETMSLLFPEYSLVRRPIAPCAWGAPDIIEATSALAAAFWSEVDVTAAEVVEF